VAAPPPRTRRAVVLPDGSPLADRCEQVPGEPIADVVGRALVAEAAEVAEGAGRRREVTARERSRLRPPVPAPHAGAGKPLSGTVPGFASHPQRSPPVW